VRGARAGELAVGEVHLWRASLDVAPTVAAALWRSLSDDERARARRFHRQQDRDRFAVGRGLLRALLAGYLGSDPAALALGEEENGKPCLEREDLAWLGFNISHSGSLVVLGVARGRAIGVDVEVMREDFPVADVAARFLSGTDQAALESAPPGQRVATFFATWTRQEAYLKALGTGLGHRTATPAPDPELWTVANVDAGPGYAAAVAVEGAGVRLPVLTEMPSAERGGTDVDAPARHTA